MTTIAFLSIAGALGALLRASLAHNLNGRIALGTLAANVVAAFALGYLSHSRLAASWGEAPSIALRVGFLGALSTWSSVANEIADHLRSQRRSDAVTVLALNLVVGIGAAWLGLRLGRS